MPDALTPISPQFASRYEIRGELGRGGTAIVYQAFDRQTGEIVAIKILRRDLSSSVSMARFVREIEIGQQLHHPNIVPIFASGTADGEVYFTMPVIEGESLRQRLQRERHLPIGDVVSIASGVADALEYAHARRVIHRDITPGNILLSRDRILVADFGIARAMTLASGEGLTESGMVIGTPQYMSPEQGTQSRDVDARSDIYALGCVVYEMLAGEPPFTGPTAQAVIARHCHEPPRALWIVRPSVTEGLQLAVEKALAKVPADRFSTPREFADALAAGAAEKPRRARTMVGVVRAHPWRSLSAALAITIAGFGVARVIPSAATRSYARGLAAMDDWDLARADSEFSRALQARPRYAEASLNLSLARLWHGAPLSQWGYSAEQAMAGQSSLDPRQQTIARALSALAQGHADASCAAWNQLTTHYPSDFTSWYGLGHCLRHDTIVVRDAHSPSGWAFRSSARGAADSYARAVKLIPSTPTFRVGALLGEVETALNVSGSVRLGYAEPPDTSRFIAYPAWRGDSLLFVPVPTAKFDAVGSGSATAGEAVVHQREQFHQVATMFRTAFPTSVAARDAVAESLDMLGDASALDTLRAARRSAPQWTDQLRLGTLEVWIEVKRAAPSDPDGLGEARRLADSLLSGPAPTADGEAQELAGLAGLTGRANRSASLARVSRNPALPLAVRDAVPTLMSYAAFGGPPDSLRSAEARIQAGMAGASVAAERDVVRSAWLFRAALLAIPGYIVGLRSDTGANANPGMKLLNALSHHDLKAAHEALIALSSERTRLNKRPPNLTPDVLYAGAAVLSALGDDHGAIAWLDPTLDSLSAAEPRVLAEPANAAALIRAMALRADLASRGGDTVSASRWANVVLTFWSGGDEFLMPTLERMRKYVR